MFSNILKDIRNKIMSIPRNVLPFSEYFDNNRPVNYQVTQTTLKQKKTLLSAFSFKYFSLKCISKTAPYLFCI
jgi:hypothetical protein